MANPDCPHCGAICTMKHGRFYRQDDARWVQRFLCRDCGRSFSNATLHDTWRQKRRRLNNQIRNALCSGVSQRRIALILGCCPRTVAFRIPFLAARAREKHGAWLGAQSPFRQVQFDELITFENTRLKPLSVAVMVAWPERKILCTGVAAKPASGRIAETSRDRYGPRRDESPSMRRRLHAAMAPYLDAENLLVETDEWEEYPDEIREAYPKATHKRYKSIRGALIGQGELKRTGHDPLFGINHTLAMLRDNIKRLSRKTWCVTRKPEVLDDILAIYTCFHNERLTARPAKR